MEDDCDTTIKDKFPEPQKKFWLRSRKRPNSDAVSVSSMDVSIGSDAGKKKKRRRITEVASNFFLSSVPTSSRIGNVLQRSFSIQANSSDLSLAVDEPNLSTIRKKIRGTNGKLVNARIRSWVVDVADGNNGVHPDISLSRSGIKRQEAIYELCCGEDVLLHDLCMLRDVYYEPLLSTGILNTNDMSILFGDISQLIEIHGQLRDELVKLRDSNGVTDTVGPIILNWVSTLTEPYIERCRTQVYARHLLEIKKASSKRFHDFLKKRVLSPHSVDLWTYLDVPRSRVVKYPLLVNEILRHTPSAHPDQETLKKAAAVLSELLTKIDKAMGDAECDIARGKINTNSEYDPMKCVDGATELITEGMLKDARGTKFYCFLFDTCFVLTRATRRLCKKYNISYPVISRDQIKIEIEEKEPGFIVGNHHLTTEDEHAQRHWVDSFSRINRISTGIVTRQKSIDNQEKENKPKAESPISKNQPKRRSLSSLCDSGFSVSLRKSLLKQKRSSVGFI
ncbi:rho guanine nucleotide exchange factor 3 [Cephus cinctus]|uniref:Rho guanine nucleotide exchange factor 3 n=1 Tax=Cephus cinctus TaxID=211228 RepID=A0AAJ7FJ53_CEPCN|nr:rho guanine nucleotide exchange factor 3 [Cephus cinctus]